MNPWKGLNKLPRELWIISAATLINRSGSMALPFLAVYINKHLNFSITDAGLVLTVYGIAALITAPIIGKVCDLLSPFKVMKLSLVTSGLFLFLFPLTEKYYQIIILTFIWSSLNEAFRPANLTLISELSSTQQRRIAFSINRLAINLGMSIGPAIGGFLAVINFSLIFYVDGTAHLLAWLFLVLLNIKITTKAKPQIKQVHQKTLDIFKENRHFFYFLLAIIPIMLVFFQMFSTMPIYLINELKYPASVYGLLFSINTVMIIIIEVPLLNYLSNISNKRLISAGCLLTAIGFGLTLFAKDIFFLILTVVIWTFGEMITFPSTAAYSSEAAPEAKRGEYMGYYQTANNIAFSAGPWLGSNVYQAFGASILWGSTFVLGVISVISLKFVKGKG